MIANNFLTIDKLYRILEREVTLITYYNLLMVVFFFFFPILLLLRIYR